MRHPLDISKPIRGLACVLLAALLVGVTCLGTWPNLASAAEEAAPGDASTPTSGEDVLEGALASDKPSVDTDTAGSAGTSDTPSIEDVTAGEQEDVDVDAPSDPDVQSPQPSQAVEPRPAETEALDVSADPTSTSGTGTFEFVNELTGIMADLTRSVDYQVLTKLPDGAAAYDVPAKVVAVDGSESPLKLSSTSTESDPVPVSLKNGERLVIENVPSGTEITVTQAGLAGYATTVAAAANNPANAADPGAGTRLVPAPGASSPSDEAAPFVAGGHMLATESDTPKAVFTFTHERGEVSATGIDEGSAALALVPALAAASLGLLLAGALLHRRMRRWQ